MVWWSDSVPKLGVEVEFVNSLSNKLESINVDSTTGTGTYSFYVGEPNRSSATSSISAKIKPKNARSIDWVQPFLHG